MSATKKLLKHLKDYKEPEFLISTISLEFELEDTETIVTSVINVVKNGNHDSPIVLDGEDMELISLALNGEQLSDYSITNTSLIIAAPDNHFQLKIVTKINPKANSKLEGLFKSGGAFCTQCEAEGFRRITYFLDRPDVLSEYRVKIIADKQNFPNLLSNGNKVGCGDLETGKHWVEWHDPHKKPCYLFALVAGDFDLLEDEFVTASGRNVALQIYVDSGNKEKAHHAMCSLKKAMKWDEEVYGLEYDLDIYMIVAVDFFNMGAMENKGLNVFNSKYVLADDTSATDDDYFNIEAVIAHEYFHNWTGNRVTCRDWFQLSLKEGLTVFRDQCFSADHNSPTVCRIEQAQVMRNHQFAEDSSPMSHPIRPESVKEMNNFYTVTVYDKGAEVIRMMHTLLGVENFRKGMDLYFERHDGQAVTCDDFVNAMEDASKIDLTLFKRWYSQSGTPELSFTDAYDEESEKYYLTVSQNTPATQDQQAKQALHIPLSVELIGKRGVLFSSEKVLSLKQQEQVFEFEHISEKPVPLLLTDFSAPAKVINTYTDNQYHSIVKNSKSEFNRWDAMQALLNQRLKATSESTSNDNFIHLFEAVLTDESLDKALLAKLICLPSEKEVGQLMCPIEVEQIHGNIKSVRNTLATELAERWTMLYEKNHDVDYQQEAKAIARRKLKNECLQYLSVLSKSKQLIEQQYRFSTNMSDTLAALSAARHHDLQLFETLMDDFDNKWCDNGLVMDKWFQLHATTDREDIFAHMETLKSHKIFSMANPNRVRSLIGSFISANQFWFHQSDGRGYQFLTEHLKILNESNPQIAARLVEPLIQFSKHTENRQNLMKQQLVELTELPSLSTDLEEKITRAIG